MSQGNDENLFDHTKMSFGAHLEELRAALIKATAALAIGFLIGLCVSGYVVEFMQRPLKQALTKYYSERAEEDYKEQLEELRASGFDIPEDTNAAVALLKEKGMVPEQRFIDPYEVAEALAKFDPKLVNIDQLANRSKTEETPTQQFMPIRLYHSIENDPRVRVVGLNMQEPFMAYIKAALMVGAILASPFIFYFIWNFIGAGLYPHEKRHINIFLPFSIVLFLAGAALAFFVAFSYVLDFLLSFNNWLGISPEPRITDWLSLVMLLPLGFGISFQLPLVMLFLERIGVVSVATYWAKWRIAIMVICVMSMVLTPAEPTSMIIMAVPLIGLYFGGIFLCQMLPKNKSAFATDETV